jgi:hypothetical protein
MANSFTETPHPAQFILTEQDGHLSRDNLKIAASQTIAVGGILVDGGAGGYVAYDKAAPPAAGTKVALAIYPAVTGVGETTSIAAITRAAEVNGLAMSWQAGMSNAQVLAAAASLAAFMIIVRGLPAGFVTMAAEGQSAEDQPPADQPPAEQPAA